MGPSGPQTLLKTTHVSKPRDPNPHQGSAPCTPSPGPKLRKPRDRKCPGKAQLPPPFLSKAGVPGGRLTEGTVPTGGTAFSSSSEPSNSRTFGRCVNTRRLTHLGRSPPQPKCGEDRAVNRGCEKSWDSFRGLAKLNPGRGEIPTERGS